MFSRDHYEAVSNAYLGGIARAPSALRPASVASVFVSRLDSKVDRALEKIGSPEALALRGKVAVANAKLIYHRFREVFDGPEFSPLRERGARLQRVLWGSTSTKNSDYSDILYVQELIGPDTVNTVPMETLHKFVDHGEARRTVDENLEEAQAHLNELAALDIDLHQVTQELQDEGVKAFADDFEDLLDNVDGKRKAFVQA
jgi:transaldolase